MKMINIKSPDSIFKKILVQPAFFNFNKKKYLENRSQMYKDYNPNNKKKKYSEMYCFIMAMTKNQKIIHYIK